MTITSKVACNVTNANNIHYQNKTIKNMKIVASSIACNVANINNIHDQFKITLL